MKQSGLCLTKFLFDIVPGYCNIIIQNHGNKRLHKVKNKTTIGV